MAHYFDHISHGFYNEDIHGIDNIPSTAVLLDEETYQRLVSEFHEGKVFSGFSLEDGRIETSVPPVSFETFSRGVRSQRDAYLKESDWTMLADSPLSEAKKTEWVAYRVALRNMTESLTSIDSDVIWPTRPA